MSGAVAVAENHAVAGPEHFDIGHEGFVALVDDMRLRDRWRAGAGGSAHADDGIPGGISSGITHDHVHLDGRGGRRYGEQCGSHCMTEMHPSPVAMDSPQSSL